MEEMLMEELLQLTKRVLFQTQEIQLLVLLGEALLL
jgi:hypothetical protein